MWYTGQIYHIENAEQPFGSKLTPRKRSLGVRCLPIILLGGLFGLTLVQSAGAGCTAAANRPCAPVNVTATIDAGPSIRVSWTLYNDPPSKVVVHRAPAGGLFPADGATISPILAGFVQDTSAALNTPYSYRVCAHYDDEPYCSNIVQQWLPSTTASTGPLTPPVFTHHEVYQDRIRVSWNKGAYVKFNLIRTERGRRLAQEENRSGTYDFYGTISGYTYTFSVQGLTQDGRRSGWSPPLEVRVNMPPRAPGNFYVEGIVPNSQYRLHWYGYRDTDMFRITRGRGAVVEKTWDRGLIEPVLAKREREYELDDTDQLTGMTEYWYEVCSSNISHRLDPINSSCVRQSIKTLATVARAPTDVRAAFVSNGAQIAWTANDDTVLWFEVERRDSMEWKIISNKLERHRDAQQAFLDANLPRTSAALGPRTMVYRVCAGNVAGRTCSALAAAGVRRDATKTAAASVMRILQIAPTRFAKANANPPQINVTLTYSGTNAKSVAYRSDGGPWVAANANVPLSLVKPGSVTVTIPTSVFQNSARAVDVRLANDASEAIGTIAVVFVDPTAQAKEGKALQTNLDKQSPAPSREPPRTPDAAPKSLSPLQQQAPGKSTGSVFQR